MTLDKLISRLQELRNETSGGTEVLIFDDEIGCLAITQIDVMDCNDEIPDWISIAVK